jgi:hypothetical protein
MYPNGVRLKENDQKVRKRTSIHVAKYSYLEEIRTSVTLNCHVGSSPLLVPPTLCDAEMRQKTYSVKKFGIDRTHKPVSNPPAWGVHGASKLD